MSVIYTLAVTSCCGVAQRAPSDPKALWGGFEYRLLSTCLTPYFLVCMCGGGGGLVDKVCNGETAAMRFGKKEGET
jgi:hypothetical protein